MRFKLQSPSGQKVVKMLKQTEIGAAFSPDDPARKILKAACSVLVASGVLGERLSGRGMFEVSDKPTLISWHRVAGNVELQVLFDFRGDIDRPRRSDCSAAVIGDTLEQGYRPTLEQLNGIDTSVPAAPTDLLVTTAYFDFKLCDR